MDASKDIEWRDPVQLYRLRKARQFRVVAAILVLLLVLVMYWFVFRV